MATSLIRFGASNQTGRGSWDLIVGSNEQVPALGWPSLRFMGLAGRCWHGQRGVGRPPHGREGGPTSLRRRCRGSWRHAQEAHPIGVCFEAPHRLSAGLCRHGLELGRRERRRRQTAGLQTTRANEPTRFGKNHLKHGVLQCSGPVIVLPADNKIARRKAATTAFLAATVRPCGGLDEFGWPCSTP
jgi:hypothetical protein